MVNSVTCSFRVVLEKISKPSYFKLLMEEDFWLADANVIATELPLKNPSWKMMVYHRGRRARTLS